MFEFKNTTSPTDQELLDDLKKVYKEHNKDKISAEFYTKHGKFNSATIIRRFGWREALDKVGCRSAQVENNPSKEKLFFELQKAWEILGKQPTLQEIKDLNKEDKIEYGPHMYQRTFGDMKKTLEEFQHYIEGDNIIKKTIHKNKSQKSIGKASPIKKQTNRNISVSRRFRILMRDGFACKSCGASPVKKPDTELHVDHIRPWSKGGETIDENLETKCKQCNLGKGNMIEKIEK